MNRLASLLLALAIVPTLHAAPRAPACLPVVRDAWARMVPTMPMGAGYFTIDNRCAAPVAIVGAASPRFASVSLHETRLENGVSRMRPLPRIDLAAGASVDFKPGGRHVMLMGATGPAAKPGETLRIDLHLADGRTLPVDFGVRNAAR